MDILSLEFQVAAGFMLPLGLGKQGLRGVGIASLLAFGLASTALAQTSEEPAPAGTEASEESESTDPQVPEDADRLKFKDPVVTIDPSADAQATRLKFSNPGSILFRLDRDAERKDFLFQLPAVDKVFDAWSDIRSTLDENYGFRAQYSFAHLYQRASDTVPGASEKEASGYETNIHGAWTLLGRESNSPTIAGFEFLRTNRLAADIPPDTLFTQTGSLYPTAAAFGETDLSVSELWLQQIFESRFGFRVGKIFPITAYDFFPLKNFRLDFVDANSVANLAIPLPDRGLGGFVMYRPDPKVYLRLGVHDANAEVEKAGFNSLFDEGELFKIFEVGFDPGLTEGQPGSPPPGDVHVSFWHQDERDKDNVDDGWGVVVSASQRFGRFLPFLRYGYSDSGRGGPAVLEHMVNGGLAFDGIFGQSDDRIGASVTWAEPANGDLDDQWAVDGFYRIQLTPEITFGPTFQVIIDPPRNPDEDVIFVGGIRSRFVF